MIRKPALYPASNLVRGFDAKLQISTNAVYFA